MMEEEKNDNTFDTLSKDVSTANSIKGALKTGKSISSAIKGAALGNPIIAADLVWKNRDLIKKIILIMIFLLILPILFITMLPSIIFGDLSDNPGMPIMNNDSAIIENMKSAEIAIWTILQESHNDIIERVNDEIEKLEETEYAVIEDNYNLGTPINSTLILSQYSASKNYDKINIDDLIETISKFKNQLFSYDVSSSSEISTNEEGKETEITTYHYTITYIGDSFFVENIFKLDREKKEIANYYAENLMMFLYGSNFEVGGIGKAQVSQDVLKYTDLIKKYAAQYGISEYFELICAVMMAESGGRVPDVMQASECPYNTKYPKKPNAIDNPEYSIDVGIHYLSDCLRGAGCTSIGDIGKISLALQGYNYGNGYISWAINNYGGYSEANAIEFSNIMKQKLNWKNYGNPRYVSAVMKYLIIGGSGEYGSPFVGRNWVTAVSSEYGNRVDPINGKPSAFHSGLDIAYPTGTQINAVESGVVILAADTNNGYGNHIKIDHGNGVVTLYGHCSKLLVSKGQKVEKGQVIAEVGATGRVTGAHLHIEFIVNGKKENPRKYLTMP